MDNYKGFVVGQKVKRLLPTLSKKWGDELIADIKENPIATITRLNGNYGVYLSSDRYVWYRYPDKPENEFEALTKKTVIIVEDNNG